MAYKNLRFGGRIVVFALALLIFLFFISFYFILDRTPATATTETDYAVTQNIFNTNGTLNGTGVNQLLNAINYSSYTPSTTGYTAHNLQNRTSNNSGNTIIFPMGYVNGTSGDSLYWQATYLYNNYLTVWLVKGYTNSAWNSSRVTVNYDTYANSTIQNYIDNTFESVVTQNSNTLQSVFATSAQAGYQLLRSGTSNDSSYYYSSYQSQFNHMSTTVGQYSIFWLPSMGEVWANTTSSVTISNTSYTGQWGLNTTDRIFNTINYDNTTTSYTWTRSKYNSSSNNPLRLSSGGDTSSTAASCTESVGVRPACHINLNVLYDAVYNVVTVKSSNESQGTVSGGGTYVGANSTTTVTATPRSGYVFDYWVDSSDIQYTRNPLTIAVTKDETYTAYFTEGVDITVQTSDSSLGSVSGGGAYALGRDVTISATPNTGVTFSHWLTNTGVKYYNNPLVLPANENITYTAYFIRNYVIVSTSNSGAEIESTSIGTTSTTTTHNLLFTTGNYISGITVNYGVEYPITAINGTLAVNDKSCTAIDFRTNPEGSMLYLAVYGARADVNIVLHFVNVAQSYSPASGGANIEGVALQVSGGIGNSLEAVGEARITGYTTTDSLTTVHVSAVASKGYYFVGWETNDNTDLSQYGSTADIPYDLIEGKILTAVFASTANSQTNGTTNNTGPEFG